MKTKKNIRPPFPIDVVYTWAGEKKSNNNRTSFNGELKYSLRSVDHFAPWVNKIYILMNTYTPPSWIKPNDKIIFIEHKDTFPSNKYLPNTNSNAIETTICNIPNLSEHYIYFNDDIFLGKKIKYTHFFTPDGKAKIITDTLNHTIKNNSLLNIPPNNYKWYGHVPIPYIKSLVIEFNKTYPEFIHWVRSTKNRINGGEDTCKKIKLNTPCQQIHFPITKFMYLKKQAISKNIKGEYICAKNFMHKIPEILKKPTIFCFNDDEPDMAKRELFMDNVFKFYKEYFPTKASFEL